MHLPLQPSLGNLHAVHERVLLKPCVAHMQFLTTTDLRTAKCRFIGTQLSTHTRAPCEAKRRRTPAVFVLMGQLQATAAQCVGSPKRELAVASCRATAAHQSAVKGRLYRQACSASGQPEVSALVCGHTRLQASEGHGGVAKKAVLVIQAFAYVAWGAVAWG